MPVQIVRHAPIAIPHKASDYTEVWAIGDVHGRADVLEALLAAIAETPVLRGRRREIVSLGDVIDRGPHSLRCIDLLMAAGAKLVMGNHEQLLLLAAFTREVRWEREGDYWLWRAQGGDKLLAEAFEPSWKDDEHPMAIPQALGRKRWDWVRTADTYEYVGDVLLVHAGVDPDRIDASLRCHWDDTSDLSPMWIRGEFLRKWDVRPRKVFVIHGHSPMDNVGRAGDEARGGRVNADLGSHASGGIRAVRIAGSELSIVDAWGEATSTSIAEALRKGRT